MIVGFMCLDHLRKKVTGAIGHCEKHKLFKKCPYESVRKYLVQTSDRVECLCCTRGGSWCMCFGTGSGRSHAVVGEVECLVGQCLLVASGSYLRQGSEKLRELECMMEDAGYWSSLWVCLSLYMGSKPFMFRYILAGTFSENFDLSLGVGDLMLDDDEEKAPEPAAKKKVQPGSLPELDGEESVTDYVAKFKRACLSKKNAYRDVLEKLAEDKVTGHQLPVCTCILSRCALPLPTDEVYNCMSCIPYIYIYIYVICKYAC